jgi:predicted nucleic acid-binding protein
LILVDTSVWIDLLNRSTGPAGLELERLIEESEPVALTGVIVTEILQGLWRDLERTEKYLSLWDMLEPIGFSTYREASALSRLARSKGFSLGTIDALIASIALENQASLFTLDQDFSHIARFTPLRLYTLPESTG